MQLSNTVSPSRSTRHVRAENALVASIDVAQLLVVSETHGKINSGGGMGIGASPG